MIPHRPKVVDAGPGDGTCERGCGRPAVTQERILNGANAPLANVCDNAGCDGNYCDKSSSGARCEFGHIHGPPCSFEESAVADPTAEELEHKLGLTYEEAERFRRFTERCEAGVSRFGNDEMSGVLALVERLRERWARAHGVARLLAERSVEDREEARGKVSEASEAALRLHDALAGIVDAAQRYRRSTGIELEGLESAEKALAQKEASRG